uniref:F-box domain-containing protein n=1 Tax=Homalodisca liturata TaxID=320908 RepID=A0A1B6I0T9_9HEMI
MDLTDLPIEMVEAVAQYLSVEDVCACSQVNSIWKNVFNSNALWSRYCTFHPGYFFKQKSKMNYVQSVDNGEHCENKKMAFKEMFVSDNVSHGKYHTSYVNCSSLYCDCVLDAVDVVGNHWLFISCMSGSTMVSEHKLQVWKISGDPSFHTCIATAFGRVSRMYVTEMKLVKDKLYIIYRGEALIYEFEYPLYELVFLCRISCNEITRTSNLCFDQKIVFISDIVIGFEFTVSHQIQKAAPSFHVWNDTGIVIGSAHDQSFNPHHEIDETLFRSSHPIVNLKSNNLDKIVVFNPYINCESDKRKAVIRVFDIESLKYLPQFYEERYFLTSVDIYKNIVALFHIDKEEDVAYGEFFDCTTGDSIYKVNFNINAHHKMVPNTQDGELVVLENNRFVVYDVTSKKVINSFIISGKGLDILILKKDVLLLESCIKGRISHEVWNSSLNTRL